MNNSTYFHEWNSHFRSYSSLWKTAQYLFCTAYRICIFFNFGGQGTVSINKVICCRILCRREKREGGKKEKEKD